MSLQPYQNPNSAVFRSGYSTEPHVGRSTGPEQVDTSVDTRAWNAFTLGVLSLLFSIVTGIPAILVGAHSLRRIGGDPTLKGRGIAWTGIVLGCLSIVAFVVAIYLFNH